MKLKSLVATTLSTYAAIAVVSSSAQAQIFSGNLDNVKWGTPSAGSNTDPVFSGVGTGTFRWGDPDDFGVGANELAFTAIPFNDVGVDSLFAIGDLTYFNGTVLLNTAVANVPLNFDFSLNNPLSLNESGLIDFELVNTPNLSDDPDQNADIVKFTKNGILGTFSSNDKEYQITLAGFSQDGGANFLDEIIGNEGETSTASLYAKITELPQPVIPTSSGIDPDNNGEPPKKRVPEPGMLFGVSLVAAYCVSRRQLDS
ncbi:MAG: choice-of-anchor K domain-containing protein [Calothrix sp. MO_192.B10]|nr:choice-of-anchor K domain-containing protein [Calothrix sp. MO_192.B10]